MSGRVKAAVLAIGVLVALTACAPGVPAAQNSSIPPTASAPAATASPTTSPEASLPAPEPVPTPEGDIPAPPAQASDWSDDALIGACKVAWNESGQGAGWSAYSPDAEIEQRGEGFYVGFAAESGDDVRDCLVEGSPGDPRVTVAP
jgi:hypothetical protein